MKKKTARQKEKSSRGYLNDILLSLLFSSTRFSQSVLQAYYIMSFRVEDPNSEMFVSDSLVM